MTVPLLTPQASPAPVRRRRGRGWLLAALLIAGLILVVVLIPRPASTTPYSTESAAPTGTRALAHVLRDQGVSVTETDDVYVAADRASAGTTLVIAPGAYLEDFEVDALVATDADLVLLDPSRTLVDAATNGAVARGNDTTPTLRPTPECDDANASAAGSVFSSGDLVVLDDRATACFPLDDEFAYASIDGDRFVSVFADADIATNDLIDEAGNAALTLRATGHNSEVTWLVPSLTPVIADDGPNIIPPWLILVGLQALVTVVVLGLWQGRRLGRVVTEPLPVVVRSSEATRGRARLYRRHGARGHAAAGLRAACARRCATRLGLPRSADRTTVVAAIARASNRAPLEIDSLLYGPPPTDDARLAELARLLDTLESEVHPL